MIRTEKQQITKENIQFGNAVVPTNRGLILNPVSMDINKNIYF